MHNSVKIVYSIEREDNDNTGNITSHLYSNDLVSLNGSNFTCEAIDLTTTDNNKEYSFTSYVVGEICHNKMGAIL